MSSSLVLLFALFYLASSSGAYDPLDPVGNITIRWDVKSWIPDGYVAASRGTLRKAKCQLLQRRSPELTGTKPAVASFQVSVGQSGTTARTVELPVNFTLKVPGPGYTCGPATKLEQPTKSITPDGRRTTQAHMTWTVTCTYSQLAALRSPTCCVSLSAFYSEMLVTCPRCSCGCQDNSTKPEICVEGNSPYLGSVMNGQDKNSLAPLVQCTSHMCPIRVHWHVRANYKDYWRVKITVTNFNYRMNYSQWNLVAQHPNFNSLTSITSFNYTALNPYGLMNDTGLLWGIKDYNEYLLSAGPDGYVQSELLFRKDPSTFTLRAGWAFPRKVYFSGEKCVLPPPDAYPGLPNASPKLSVSVTLIPLVLLLVLTHSYF